jgi:hypothetical protein
MNIAYLVIAAAVGILLGLSLAGIPLYRKWKRDKQILEDYMTGKISFEEAYRRRHEKI